jgi:hypothetical protein
MRFLVEGLIAEMKVGLLKAAAARNDAAEVTQ